MVGKQIVEFFQSVILLSVCKSFKFDSKINKHILNTNNIHIYIQNSIKIYGTYHKLYHLKY